MKIGSSSLNRRMFAVMLFLSVELNTGSGMLHHCLHNIVRC